MVGSHLPLFFWALENMKIGKINQQGDITTRQGSDSTNPESPNGESFNITTGSSSTASGGSINLIVGSGAVDDGFVIFSNANTASPVRLKFKSDGHYFSLYAHPSLANNVTMILPQTTGSTGQYLKATTNSGETDWSTIQISDVQNLQSTLDSITNASGVSTFSAGTTGLTPSTAISGAVTLAGTLNVANGGTGQTTYTNGQLLIGNSTGNTLSKSTLTAGGTVTITNGAGTITISASDQFTGTVTSVAALTLGTTGTDLSSTVATGTTTPVITLNVPTASATARGALSSTDWTTFNNKQAALVSGTNIKTVGGLTLLGSGDAGTITVPYGGTGLTSITANNLMVGNGTSAVSLVAPTGTNSRLRWTGTAYSWIADTLANLTDVAITTPSTNQVLTWNGTAWVNSSLLSSPTSFSTVVSSWTLVSGNLYSATVTHNLGTKNVSVTLYNTATNTIVYPDNIVLTSNNALTLTVTSNTHTINVTVIANGTTIAPSSNAITVQVNGSSLGGTYSAVNFVGSNLTGSVVGSVATVTQTGTLIERFTYQAASLESPNNADWVINSMAPAISDPTYGSLLVRSFATGAENGVGFYATIPTGSSSITFNFKGRAATAPGATSTVVLKLYTRSIPNNSAVGSWSAATTLVTLSIPANAFYQYGSVTVSLASLGLTSDNFYEFELTRNGGTLASAWYMAEMNMEIN